MVDASNVRHVSGLVARTAEVASDYPENVVRSTRRIRWLDGRWSSEDLCAIRADDAIVTSAFTVIDPRNNRYLLDQSYAHVKQFFGLNPQLCGDHFTFKSTVNVWEGPHVVLGGPIDNVWHHWLLQWSARLVLVKALRPDLLANPAVKFLVHDKVYDEPFMSTLRAYGISESRMALIDPSANHQLPEAYLVSFLDQNYYYPEIMDAFTAQVRAGLGVPIEGPPSVRLFCSRQGFDMPKRRVANFEAIAPLLQKYGFRIIDLAALTAEDQFRLFTAAEVVMGVHGADLAGLLFCQPGAKLLLMENERNIVSGLAGTYRTLADLRGMTHATMLVDEVVEDGVDYTHFGEQHNRDYVIDPTELESEFATLGLAAI